MTNQTRLQPRHHRQPGFTIVEILVVVAIIAALVAILLPSLSGVYKHANIATTNSRLQALRSALEQYHTDFGIYPPSTSLFPAGTPYGPNVGLPAGRGQAMLAQALMGYMPFDIDGAGPKNANGTTSTVASDPAFGFRTRPGGFGKVYGPYAPSDPKTYRQNTIGLDECFIDSFGNEILYFRSTNFLRTDPTAGPRPGLIFDTLANNGAAASPTSYFLSDDCSQKYVPANTPPYGSNSPYGPDAAPSQFYQLISSSNSNTVSGVVNGSTSYLLVGAGPDGIYFTADDIIVSK